MDDGDAETIRVRMHDALLGARVREPSVAQAPSLPDASVVDPVVRDVLSRHDGPRRRHHGRRHLVEMLAEIDRLVEVDDRWGQVPATVELAVLFHDVVHDPDRDDNEERSARVAIDTLSGLGIATALCDEVARLIRVTEHHEPEPDDPAGQLLVDGDLWILSAPPPRYDRYVADVRYEYGDLDDRRWRRGRARVLDQLRDLLDRHGYWVGPEPDRERRTAAARANIEREREALTGVTVP